MVMARHPRFYHFASHDVRQWSICILVLNGVWLRGLLRGFSVG